MSQMNAIELTFSAKDFQCSIYGHVDVSLPGYITRPTKGSDPLKFICM